MRELLLVKSPENRAALWELLPGQLQLEGEELSRAWVAWMKVYDRFPVDLEGNLTHRLAKMHFSERRHQLEREQCYDSGHISASRRYRKKFEFVPFTEEIEKLIANKWEVDENDLCGK